MELARFWDLTTATAASAARPNFGNVHAARSKIPERPLEIYEFEVCPYCRIAREAISALSLDPIVYPCPKGGTRFREKVKREGGKHQFPYLVDPNTGVAMYESADITKYLFETYGDGRVPWFLRQRSFAVSTSMLASGWRRRALRSLYVKRRSSRSASSRSSSRASHWAWSSSPECGALHAA